MADLGSARNANPTIHAVVGGGDPGVERALDAQDPSVSVVRAGGALRAGIERALADRADWIWVLDGSAAPRPGALAALLDAAERARTLAAPALLAGIVVTADRRPDPRRPLWFDRERLDLAMAAAERRLMPLRATAGPVLVAAGAAAGKLPPPDAPLEPAAVFEWTAHLLRERPGYLAVESESEAVRSIADPLGDPAVALRLVRGGALAWPDKIVLGYKLASSVGARLSAPARRARLPAP